MSSTLSLLDDALDAIINNAIQEEAFFDSCSITGQDYESCVFCNEDNQESARSISKTQPIKHQESCIYVRAIDHRTEQESSD